MAIEATYESRCAWCDGNIIEGDSIEECEGEWVHEKCAQEMEDEEL